MRGSPIEPDGYQGGIEIRPLLRWVLASVGVGGICWLLLLAFAWFGWPSAGWTGKAILIWLSIVGGAVSVFVPAGWKNLYLIADATEIRFGKRSLARSRVSEIRTGPVATTASQFWLGVVVMALAQDLTPRVYFQAADGRVLLETTDLYGSTQLARFASYLQIPFAA